MILSLIHFLIKSQEHECGSNLLLQISFRFLSFFHHLGFIVSIRDGAT
jgi:hypothetical protein